MVDVVGDLVDGEGDGPAVVAELGDPEVLEVGDDGVAGPLVLGDGAAGEVVAGLLGRGVEVSSQRLGFTDDNTGPEQVDVSGTPGGRTGGVTFEELDALRDHSEAAQQVRPELLGVGLLSVLGSGVAPIVDDGAPIGGEAVEMTADRAAVKLSGSHSGGHSASLR